MMPAMINPIREVRSFVRAALVVPVPRDHRESDAAFRRRLMGHLENGRPSVSG